MKATQKLLSAVAILSDEMYVDTSPAAFLRTAARLRVTQAQIYSAMRRFGYTWSNHRWQRNFPAWLARLASDDGLDG